MTDYDDRPVEQRAAMVRILNVCEAYLARRMNWTKALDAVLTEVDGQLGRGGRVGEAHLPEIRS